MASLNFPPEFETSQISFMMEKSRIGACGFTVRPQGSFWPLNLPNLLMHGTAGQPQAPLDDHCQAPAWSKHPLSGVRQTPRKREKCVNQGSSVPFSKPTSQIKSMWVCVQRGQDCPFSWIQPYLDTEGQRNGVSSLTQTEERLHTCFVWVSAYWECLGLPRAFTWAPATCETHRHFRHQGQRAASSPCGSCAITSRKLQKDKVYYSQILESTQYAEGPHCKVTGREREPGTLLLFGSRVGGLRFRRLTLYWWI